MGRRPILRCTHCRRLNFPGCIPVPDTDYSICTNCQITGATCDWTEEQKAYMRNRDTGFVSRLPTQQAELQSQFSLSLPTPQDESEPPRPQFAVYSKFRLPNPPSPPESEPSQTTLQPESEPPQPTPQSKLKRPRPSFSPFSSPVYQG